MTSSNPKFYTWKNFRCAYQVHTPQDAEDNLPLLLIHPIGVGLSGNFWQRFTDVWLATGQKQPLYNPDLLGCGASDMPSVAYDPSDWAEQLQYLVETVIKKPVIVVVQGALLAVAISLIEKCPQLIKGLVLAGPPGWQIMTKASNPQQQKLLWNLLFNSPLGRAFYQYARRRQFIESFSIRQLFADAETVDNQWLDELEKGAVNPKSRYAVFSFLAGFWRKDYAESMGKITQPTLVLIGEKASNISRSGIKEKPEERLELYLKNLPNSQGYLLPGRNVLPYELTKEFVAAVAKFVNFNY
ncbi:MAG: alpha/beta hydrolase [Gomphosphaeria aponina SAG 52.96 = DSM 107014]|uniref:Alpha/beta hydrolase n=1 Tax=Gomphosphaeria aponina SAG 52.96 = DSM 107014 TaxID=1521640 RepID=A0A941GYW4_9CHRO|nr:alpha/beta hydrolase [Gomphosphaeria aponina SAG 52.96 = DSM 107014]